MVAASGASASVWIPKKVSGRTWTRTTDLLHVRPIGGKSADIRGSPKLSFVKGIPSDALSTDVRRIPLISGPLATVWLQRRYGKCASAS